MQLCIVSPEPSNRNVLARTAGDVLRRKGWQDPEVTVVGYETPIVNGHGSPQVVLVDMNLEVKPTPVLEAVRKIEPKPVLLCTYSATCELAAYYGIAKEYGAVACLQGTSTQLVNRRYVENFLDQHLPKP